MLSVAVCGWLLKKQLDEADRQLAAGEGDPLFLGMKLAAATYYLEHVVPEASGLRCAAIDGAANLYAIPAQAFTA
jgi:hypothetical protein